MGISADGPADDFMREGLVVAVGADPHAYIAVRTDPAPVIVAGFGIQLPSKRAVYFLYIPLWD